MSKRYMLILLSLLLLSSCGSMSGGGGADVGNPIVTGVILTDSLTPAPGVPLTLLPSDYIASREGPRTQQTVTDSNGAYSFTIETDHSYTLWASQTTATGYQNLFRRGISVEQVGSTLYDQLKSSVQLEIQLPENYPIENHYFTLPGIPSPLPYEHDSSRDVVTIFQVPQGPIAEITLVDDSENSLQPITDSLQIADGPIQKVSAFEQWYSYTKANSLLQNDTLYAVYRTGSSAWYGSFGGGLYSDDETHYTTADGLPSNTIFALREDTQGVLWCGTNRGVASVKAGLISTEEHSQPVPQKAVFDLIFDPAGRLWCASDSGLYCKDGTSWSHFTPATTPLSNDLLYALEWQSDTLFIGTMGGGICTFDGTNWDSLTTTNSAIGSNYIYDITFDSKGNLWCATANGIAQRIGNQWQHFRADNSSLPHNTIWAIEGDDQGTIWAATVYGLARITESEMRILTDKNSRLQVNHCFSISASESEVLFGSAKGVISLHYE